jgi:flagellar assembly factor FliW
MSPGRSGLAIVAMRQLPRGFCNLSYKMSQKEAFTNFLAIIVWNAAEAFLSQSARESSPFHQTKIKKKTKIKIQNIIFCSKYKEEVTLNFIPN